MELGLDVDEGVVSARRTALPGAPGRRPLPRGSWLEPCRGRSYR